MIQILSAILSPILVFVAFLIGRWIDERHRKEDKVTATNDDLKELIEANGDALGAHIAETELRDAQIHECLTMILKNQLWEIYHDHEEDHDIPFDVYQRASNAWHGYHTILGQNHEMTDVWNAINEWYGNKK